MTYFDGLLDDFTPNDYQAFILWCALGGFIPTRATVILWRSKNGKDK